MSDVQIPKKHKAIVYDRPGSISTKSEELDVPEPGPGEVLINLYVHDYTGIANRTTEWLCVTHILDTQLIRDVGHTLASAIRT